jgi:hypothetical protein
MSRPEAPPAVAFGADVEYHVGVVAGELRELRPHDGRNRHRGRHEADRARRLRPQAADVRDRGRLLNRLDRYRAVGLVRDQGGTVLERGDRRKGAFSQDPRLLSGPLQQHRPIASECTIRTFSR